MVAALPFLLGMQYLLAFLAYDTTAIPREALHPRLPGPAEPSRTPADDRSKASLPIEGAE